MRGGVSEMVGMFGAREERRAKPVDIAAAEAFSDTLFDKRANASSLPTDEPTGKSRHRIRDPLPKI